MVVIEAWMELKKPEFQFQLCDQLVACLGGEGRGGGNPPGISVYLLMVGVLGDYLSMKLVLQCHPVC